MKRHGRQHKGQREVFVFGFAFFFCLCSRMQITPPLSVHQRDFTPGQSASRTLCRFHRDGNCFGRCVTMSSTATPSGLLPHRQRRSTCICCCIAEEQWSSELLYAEQNPFSNMKIIHLASVCVKIPTCPGFSRLDLQGRGVTDSKMHIDKLPLSAYAKRQPL